MLIYLTKNIDLNPVARGIGEKQFVTVVLPLPSNNFTHFDEQENEIMMSMIFV